MTIERRGRSHKAVCSCSWKSHVWNELRPAEADAWHHVFGDEVIVDVAAIPDERSVPAATAGGSRSGAQVGGDRLRAIDDLVQQARDLADRPSPYTRGAAFELWRRSGESRGLVTSAVGDIEELLARHDRRNSGAADSEWLQLITAKRLLIDSLGYEGEPARRGGALI